MEFSISFIIELNLTKTSSKKNLFQKINFSFTLIKFTIASIKIYFLGLLKSNSAVHFSFSSSTITPNALLTVTLSPSLPWNSSYFAPGSKGRLLSSSMFLVRENIIGQFFIDRMHLRIVYGGRCLKMSDMTVFAYGLVMKDLDK
jgi:hypothetical protein